MLHLEVDFVDCELALWNYYIFWVVPVQENIFQVFGELVIRNPTILFLNTLKHLSTVHDSILAVFIPELIPFQHSIVHSLKYLHVNQPCNLDRNHFAQVLAKGFGGPGKHLGILVESDLELLGADFALSTVVQYNGNV